MPNKQVMRLNEPAYCAGCKAKVNPYVIERNPQANTRTLECPCCEYKWTEEVE